MRTGGNGEHDETFDLSLSLERWLSISGNSADAIPTRNSVAKISHRNRAWRDGQYRKLKFVSFSDLVRFRHVHPKNQFATVKSPESLLSRAR